jgi:hypothetical protein
MQVAIRRNTGQREQEPERGDESVGQSLHDLRAAREIGRLHMDER